MIGDILMQGFHGTSTHLAVNMLNGSISVNLGGGELGAGFYTGEYLHVAKRWAYQRYGNRRKNVLEINVDDNIVINMKLIILKAGPANFHRVNIKQSNETRTFRFGCDMVWSKIVGSDTIQCNQHKWESQFSESVLNGSACAKSVV